MAELVDAPDLGSGFARSEGSIPFIRTLKNRSTFRGGAILIRMRFIPGKKHTNFVGADCVRPVDRLRLSIKSVRAKNIGYVHDPPATERRIDLEVSSRLCASRQVRANSSSPLKWTKESASPL
jgi:hypothetical protein